MVVVLLMILFLALLSIAFWVYARSLLTAAAAQAARYAANADVPDSAVVARVQDTMAGTLADGTAATISCSQDDTALLVGVTCSMRSPGLIGLLDGVLPAITVTGHAAKEP